MRRLWWLMSTAFLMGCMASGTKVDQEKLGQVQKGQTRYEEVLRIYGKPQQNLLRDDQSRQVTYSYQQMQANPLSFIPIAGAFIRSGSSEHTATVFEFDAWGVLQSYTSTQGESVTGTGFLTGGKSR